MLQQAFSLVLPILYFMLPILSVSTANSNVYVQCSQLNFTSKTPYESNINSLFTSLIDSANHYNFNKFETSPQTNVVYGLFQCRGDLSSSNCKDCVAKAVSQLKTACPTSIGGAIQLDGCFVKYDDTSFFGGQNKVEVCRKCGPSDGYNSDVSNRIDDALAFLVGGNGEYFRSGDFGSIKGVAQCEQDLSLSDCQDCLLEASGRLRSECETSTWGDMYLEKCYVRYCEQGNYLDIPDEYGNPTSDDNNPPSDNKKKKKGKRGKKHTQWRWILDIIFTGIGGGGLSFTCSCYAYNNNKCGINECCNTYYGHETDRLWKQKSNADTATELAKDEANKAKKELEKIKAEHVHCVRPMQPPYPCMPMPPPCPYGLGPSYM